MKEFLHSLFSGANGRWSTKRLVGCLCFGFVFVTLIVSMVTGDELGSEETGLIEKVLYMGAALLGCGVFEKKYKNGDSSEVHTTE